MSKCCVVVCDTAQGLMHCELSLADEADIAAALAAARLRIACADIDWEHAATGIFGRIEPRTAIPQHGDRIELYRALLVDPRSARRARAARAGARP